MGDGGRDEGDRRGQEERHGRKAGEPGGDGQGSAVEQVVDRMEAEGGRPVHLLHAVVDLVEAPQGPAVEQPVQPVLGEVGGGQQEQDL